MNDTIFWRVVWKEYRIQRAFWISIVVMTVLAELVVLVTAANAGERTLWLFGVALALPACYALGCGATLFATEHETGTYEFQRVLPVAAGRLFLGKIAFAAISTLSLFLLLWSMALILAGWRLPHSGDHLALWGLWGFAAVELLVWGVFFSLQSTQPLKAAILTVTTVSVTVHFTAAVFTRSPMDFLAADLYLTALGYRAAVAAAVAAADVWLGWRWFLEAARGSLAGTWGESRKGLPEKVGRGDWRARLVRGPGLGRLLWHQWRQSARMMGTLAAVALLLGLASAWLFFTFQNRSIDLVSPLVAIVMASLMGSSVFGADQRRHRFRFFAERGVRPGYVWLSRQLIWLPAVLLLTAVVFAVSFGPHVPEFLRAFPDPNLLREFREESVLLVAATAAGVFVGCVSLAYSAGQLASMFFRSGLLAGVFGLVLTALLCAWTGLMCFLEIPLLWSVVPIPLVLLAATWLRTAGWILERNCVRAWLLAALCLAVPGAALLAGVPAYRVYSIPAVDPGFSPEAYAKPATPEERATLEMYERAYRQIQLLPRDARPVERDQKRGAGLPTATPRLSASDAAWIELNEEAIAIALEASRRPECNFFDPFGQKESPRAYALGNLLTTSARQLESEGQLDAALERYLGVLRISVHLRSHASFSDSVDRLETPVYDLLLQWATHPDQTPERIADAVRRIEEATRDRPSRSDAIKSAYLRVRPLISADPDAMNDTRMTPQEAFQLWLWAKWLPWERARALRLLNSLTADSLSRYERGEAALAKGGTMVDFRYGNERMGRPFQLATYETWLPTNKSLFLELAHMETRRRAVRLQLALAAWQLEHGELPETLDALEGRYLDRLPLDPYSGDPFRYFPEGLPIPTTWSDGWRRGRRTIKAGRPFLWSVGLNVDVWRTSHDRSSISDYRIVQSWRRDETRTPTSEYDLWQSGLLFPLP